MNTPIIHNHIHYHHSEFPGENFDKAHTIHKAMIVGMAILVGSTISLGFFKIFSVANPLFLFAAGVLTFAMSLKPIGKLF